MVEIGTGAAEDDTFWQFSLAFYARPGVAEALLALQDRAGFDVNLLLFALWLGHSGRARLDRVRLATADAAIRPIRVEIVEPLRRLRRRLKGDPAPDIAALRQAIGALELAAEKAAQDRLAGLAGPPSPELAAGARRAAAAANLTLCLGAEHAACAEAAILCRSIAAFIDGAA